MNNPKISIITVCFNSEKHLEEAIKSVLEQDYINKEYIIIDGGSKDDTISIIEKYKKQISYFISEPDNGISDAFNKGIRAATGDVIGILNSDDKLEAGALQTVANAFEDGVTDVARGILKMWNDRTGVIAYSVPTLNWPKIPLKMGVAHPSTFVSREIYQKFGVYDTECRYAMDLDILLRWERNGVRVKYVDKPLAFFRLGGMSQSDESRRRKELLRILKKNGSNGFQVFVFDVYYRFRLFVKHFISIFGEDIRFKLSGKSFSS